jgi:hypothetical protein
MQFAAINALWIYIKTVNYFSGIKSVYKQIFDSQFLILLMVCAVPVLLNFVVCVVKRMISNGVVVDVLVAH